MSHPIYKAITANGFNNGASLVKSSKVSTITLDASFPSPLTDIAIAANSRLQTRFQQLYFYDGDGGSISDDFGNDFNSDFS